MKLLIATNNAHKTAEIRAILGGHFDEIFSLKEAGLDIDVVEDGDTFEANALKKAVEALRAAEGIADAALSDDSGLMVDALGGAPGVRSARYAGEPSDPAANNAKLLRALDGVANRAARFRCALALAAPDGRAWCVEGRCEGRIAHAAAGGGGFGYDPLFVPDGQARTFAELPAAEKHRLSHRGAALAAAAAQWGGLLTGEGA